MKIISQSFSIKRIFLAVAVISGLISDWRSFNQMWRISIECTTARYLTRQTTTGWFSRKLKEEMIFLLQINWTWRVQQLDWLTLERRLNASTGSARKWPMNFPLASHRWTSRNQAETIRQKPSESKYHELFKVSWSQWKKLEDSPPNEKFDSNQRHWCNRYCRTKSIFTASKPEIVRFVLLTVVRARI